MPKKPIDYSRTIIYKIVCKDLSINNIYVGHTTDWIKRKYQHKNACINENNKKHNRKVYEMIRENGGWNKWEMVEIEKYPCNDSNEARAKEREWYETLNANMNTYNPLQTKEERKEYNYNLFKPKSKEYRKKFYEKNKEKFKEKIKCVCGSEYRKTCKARHERSKKHIEFIEENNID